MTSRLLAWLTALILRLSPLLWVYVALGILGWMFLTGRTTAVKLALELDTFGGLWWPWSLTVAAWVAVVGALNLPWIPAIWSLLLESVGSCVLVYAVATYAAVQLFGPTGNTLPYWTIILTFGVAASIWLRCLHVSIAFVRVIRSSLAEQRRLSEQAVA